MCIRACNEPLGMLVEAVGWPKADEPDHCGAHAMFEDGEADIYAACIYHTDDADSYCAWHMAITCVHCSSGAWPVCVADWCCLCRCRQLGGKSIETMETLTNDKATLEVQLATQVRQQAHGERGSDEQANGENVFSHQLSKDIRHLCCPAFGSRRSNLLVLWFRSGKLVSCI